MSTRPPLVKVWIYTGLLTDKRKQPAKRLERILVGKVGVLAPDQAVQN